MADSHAAMKRTEDQVNGPANANVENGSTGAVLSNDEPALKRVKLETPSGPSRDADQNPRRERMRGVAMIKEE